MGKRIEGMQDVKLELTGDIPECPICIDERMVELAGTIGYLVCPNCDVVIKEVRYDVQS